MSERMKYADLLKTNTEPPLFLVSVRAHEFGASGDFVVSESCPSNWLGVEETAFRGELDNHDAIAYVRTSLIPDAAFYGNELDCNFHWPDLFPEMLGEDVDATTGCADERFHAVPVRKA